jgi:hypothetical protein
MIITQLVDTMVFSYDCHAVVITVIKPSCYIETWNFLTSWATTNFSSRILCHGVYCWLHIN